MRRLPLVVLVALVGACSAGSDAARPTSTTAPPTTAPPATAPPSTAPEPAEFAVGSRTIELVDPSRPTGADEDRGLAEQPDRTIPVLILHPAAGEVITPTAPQVDLPVADGAFPLVVFSHGVTATGPTYTNRLQAWARAGYVVAAPTYPLSSGPGGEISDYVNQPADVTFVIDQLLALPADDPLAGHFDEEAIAVAGHSLGAITTLGVSLNGCCADDRLDAAVEISGLRLPFPEGDFDDLGRVPLLAVHGATDRTVSVSGSDTLFEEVPGPAAYLRFPDGGHSDILTTDGPLIDQVVIAFLDAFLKDDEEGLAEVPVAVAGSGRATFATKPDPG